jgi:alanine dehydrogenase
MKVGVPTEVKVDEYRVALTPAGVRELVDAGHEVSSRAAPARARRSPTSAYVAQGAKILPDAEAVFGEAEMIVKVKEPQPVEVAMLEPRHTAVHLPAPGRRRRADARPDEVGRDLHRLRDRRGLARRLPLLAPMSEVAGKIATQAGAFMLEKPLGGRGILLGGVPGVAAANVMIIGGGVVGMNAAFIALGMEATVYVFDRNIDRLRELDIAFGGRADTCFATTLSIEERLPDIDLVIGAVLVHGAKAPHVITRKQLGLMKRTPCWSTSRSTRAAALRPRARRPTRPDLRGRRDHALLRGEHAGRGSDHLDLRADQRDHALRDRCSLAKLSTGAALRSAIVAADQRRVSSSSASTSPRASGHLRAGRRGGQRRDSKGGSRLVVGGRDDPQLIAEVRAYDLVAEARRARDRLAAARLG